jgi:hypothetical protein
MYSLSVMIFMLSRTRLSLIWTRSGTFNTSSHIWLSTHSWTFIILITHSYHTELFPVNFIPTDPNNRAVHLSETLVHIQNFTRYKKPENHLCLAFCLALAGNDKANSCALSPMSVPHVLINRCSFRSYQVVLLIYNVQNMLPPATLSLLGGGGVCNRNWTLCLSVFVQSNVAVRQEISAAGFNSSISLNVCWCNVQCEWCTRHKCEQDRRHSFPASMIFIIVVVIVIKL